MRALSPNVWPAGGGASSPCVNAGASTPQKGEPGAELVRLKQQKENDLLKITSSGVFQVTNRL